MSEEANQPPATADLGDDFLSGASGQVFGIRATGKALAADALASALTAASARPRRLRRAAAGWPRRRVLVLSIERAGEPNLLADAHAELVRSRHQVELASTTSGARGRFENLNALLAAHPAAGHDWLLLVDDDVLLPAGFLDAFIFLSERFSLRLAQPAHRRYSHAAWEVTRRRATSVVRETRFVEIGPVTALHAVTFEALLPFPQLRIGWGLDAHWSAVARERGWRIGIVDATPIRHGIRRIGASYDPQDAIAEARSFLLGRPYTTAAEAQRSLVTHRSWS